MTRSTTLFTLAGLVLLVGAGATWAQDTPEPARVERVFVPEEAFDRVVKRFPRGVVVRDKEFDELLRLAGLKPAPVAPEALPPVPTAIRHVRVSGSVKEGVATLTCEAEVSVLASDEVALLLPLRNVGLRQVTVDGAPARVLSDAAGIRVLLAGTGGGAPVTRRVAWELGARIEAGEERGAGILSLPVPTAASGMIDLLVPGDVEVVLPTVLAAQAQAAQNQAQNQMSRGRTNIPDDARGSRGCVAWARGLEGGSTRVEGAFGGAASAGSTDVVVSWRPRRSVMEVTPYVVADEKSVFCVRQGVVTLESAAVLEVYRAGRDRFALDLPPGFVVRSLAVEGEEVTHVQRGDRAELTFGAPRTGKFVIRLKAELTTGSGDERQNLVVQPLGFPDANRASGLVGLAQAEGTVVTFEEVQGLERADAGDIGAAPTGDRLLRVYRRLPGVGRIQLAAASQAPRVDLVVRSVLGLGERELRALAIYQFRVQEGRVFRLSAEVPGFEVETVQVREVRGGVANDPVHQLTVQGGSVLVELQQALRAGDELFLNVQAIRDEPQGLADRTFELPRLSGAPATSMRGHLGFAPDEAFRLTGSELSGLTAIPAAELPRSGLDVAGLVVGYRIDGADYAGKVHLTPRETRVSAHLTTHHRVAERVVETDTLLDLDIEGAPIAALELLLPAGLGRIARIEAADLKDDRESLGLAPDGRERWKLAFDERKSGRLPIRVRFDTTLGAVEGGADPAVELPRVSVVGAFRERGVVAVFSSDATELQAEPIGLRAIEVTDVTSLPGATLTGRPLFAYTHTGAEQHLKVTIKRRDAAQILSAVVERMELRTSTAPDGLSRHEAVFHVRHLETQFFALRLPEGATLWSVVVAGQGVKPAEKDGLKIVPMPATSEGREADTVSVTYTLRSAPWGVASRADLVAPELLIDRDRPVPVLRTVWSLALPDDYRVLEYSGNLHGSEAEAARPIALGLWRSASELTFAFALLVLTLGVGASARARAWLVGGLASSGGNARGFGHIAMAIASRRGVQVGCFAVIALAVVGFCLLSVGRSKMQRSYEGGVATRTASAPGAYEDYDAKPDAGGGRRGDGNTDMPTTPIEAPGAHGYAEEAEKRLSDEVESKDKAADFRRMRESNAAPAEPPAPPAVAPAPRPSSPPRPQRAAEGRRDRQEARERSGLDEAQDSDGAEADDGLMAKAEAEAEAGAEPMSEAAPKGAMAPGLDPAGPDSEPMPQPMQQLDPPAELLDRALALKKPSDVLAPVVTALTPPMPEGPEGGRIGLRSLVLDLPIVGRGASFERPGGEGRLVVELVRDDALTLAAGALALFGLVAGLLLPGRFRLSYLGVLLVSLAVLTAVPYVLQDGRWTPLLNALAFGVLMAAPVQAVRALGRLAAGARAATTQSGPRDEALRALSILDGLLAAGCLVLTIFAVSGGAPPEVTVFFGLVTATLLVGCVGLSLQARWALLPTLLVGLGLGGIGAIGLQEALRDSNAGGVQAFMVAWTLLFGLAGLSALALLATPRAVTVAAAGGASAPVAQAVGRALVVLLGLFLFGGSARADEPTPPGTGEPPRVYVPYDPANPELGSGEVYVPEDVYLDLWRRAYPERVTVPAAQPLAPYAIGQVGYEGSLEAQGLTLQAQVAVEILAAGWQRCPLGLAGTGLKSSRVQGGKAGARVRAAPAGGLELMAEGPGSYVLTLDLVVPFREGGYVFAAVPAHAATLKVRTTIRDRRVVVGGARAQVEEQAADGAMVVDASLGDAQRVHLTLPTREVMSAGGASEAAATTRSVVWVRPGRVVVMTQVTFDVTGAGREGFLFDVPAGLEITSVQTEGLRAWRVDEQRRLELSLRRATGPRATVLVWGEQAVAPGTTRFKAPQVVPTGVSRESGIIGVCVETGMRARPVDPAPASLRQVASSQVQNLADGMRAGGVERAYEFARRPAELELEIVQEPVEIKADADVRGVILGDRMLLNVDIAYEVRRGKVHELAVAIPVGFELAQAPQGLDVRESAVVVEQGGTRVLHFALATGLSGTGRLTLVLERPMSAGEASVPFPDVRPLGVGSETTAISVAAAQGLRVRPQQEPPPGLTARDVRAATRGRDAPAGAEWVLAYQRQNGRMPGVTGVSLTVSQPSPKVTGSWTLHARVERDVVRYTMRVVYRIADAGASTFHLLLPEGVADRVAVDGENQREVRNEPAGEGTRRLTVELQSPAEDAYELGATWEEVLGAGQKFTIPQVGLEGVERQARRFVLIETASDVSDKLVEAGLTGSIEKARASEAPVLPGPASDFSFAYRLGTPEGPWSASFHLKEREVKLPPAARVPWVELTSVFTTDGVVRHRARYRVHNLRLQFLRLQLPPKAEVWSVFVAGAPKRLHHEQGITLIPLPKGTDADLSFDVEVIFATPLPGAIGFGGALRPEAPVLRTPDVQVERTSWTLHVPADYDCRGFDGNLKPATAAASGVQALVEEVNELKKLVDLAENASGSTKEVAQGNLQLQLARVNGQIETCFALDVEKGAAVDRELLNKNRVEVQRLESTLDARRQQQQQAGSPTSASDTANVTVDGKSFERLNSGWYSNNEVAGENAKTRWAGVPQGGEAAGPGQSAEQSWTLSIPEGQTLSLSNAEVFSGEYATQTELPAEQQRQQNTQNARRVLGNRGYDAGQQAQAEQQVVVGGKVISLEEAMEQIGRATGRNIVVDGEQDPTALKEAIDQLRARGLYREGDKDGDGTLAYGDLYKLTGRGEGLLSIQVPFETPGRAYHFATDTQESPQLAFSVYPEGMGEQARRGGRGLVLLVLLVGLARLGLLAPLAGRGALQALLLGVAGVLAAAVFLHVGGAVAALAVGLVGIRHGRLFGAPTTGEAAPRVTA